MNGLYSKDYFRITEEEKNEEKRLKQENTQITSGGFEIVWNYYFDKPKAIRHYESLFPNNYLDIADLRECDKLEKQCDEFEKLINHEEITELSIKSFIQDNRYYFIPASLFRHYDFGHHDAYLFKEFSLGTSYRADYLLVGKSSCGYSFVLVEFENPYKNITVKSGEYGDTIRKGISQINDWDSFLQSEYSAFSSELKKYTNKSSLPFEFTNYDATRFHFVVIAGRRTDFSEKSYRLRRNTEMKDRIKILHYDNLLDDARYMIGQKTY